MSIQNLFVFFMSVYFIASCQSYHIQLHGDIYKPYCGGARPTQEQEKGVVMPASYKVYIVFDLLNKQDKVLKKNSLIELIDGILKNNNIYDVLVYDGIRSNPYCEDELFEFIKLNMKNIDENIYKKYKLRNDDLRNIVSKTSFSNKIYFSTYDIAKKNKIKEYWKNLWGLPEKYFEEDVISNIILK